MITTRPELQIDADMLPGQIVYLHELIERIKAQEEPDETQQCCHKTVFTRCEGCPYD